MEEDLEPPPVSHPRLNRPRVSFSSPSGIENTGFSGESTSNSASFEMEPIPISNRRRVSITAGGDAVIVKNADKSYRSGVPVLNGYNMTVPSGSIYGLLGSSGCGKTTVLSCIVGQRKLDKGEILIFGHKPGTRKIGVPGRNIGYMPQDVSLYLEFSIRETLEYFGTLCGLNKEEVKEEKAFLIKLLDLPEESRRISTLSGGQKRRVSFASALIHSPELLILDEPTVGVDPLLRQNIWDHLRKLVNSKRTTVIITTHYIEECRQANNIGIMRSGRLLAERQPNELFDEYNSTNLESIVLNLSRRDTQAKLDPSEMAEAVSRVSSSRREVDQENHKMADVMTEAESRLMDAFVRIKALTGKNFSILARNPLLLFFVVFVASMMLFIMCTALGNDPIYMKMALVNNEVESEQVCVNATRADGECNVENLSCLFLSQVPSDRIDWRIYDNEKDALAAIERGNIWGFLSFPKEFSSQFYERLSSGSNVDDALIDASQFVVRLDESNKQISAAIKKVLYDAYKDFVHVFLTDCGFDSRQAKSVLKYQEPLFGKDDTDFREFLAPGTAPSLLFFYPIITTSIRLIKEKKNGVLDRSLVVGVATWEIMIAYSISEFFVLLCQSLLAYSVLRVFFQIPILGSDILVIAIFLLSGYGGVAMGFLVGSICSEEIAAAIFAIAAFLPNFILSGIVWPVEGMAVALQYIVPVLPCTLTGEAARSITSRGWEFSHPNVYPGFCIATGYIVGYFILTVLYHKLFKK